MEKSAVRRSWRGRAVAFAFALLLLTGAFAITTSAAVPSFDMEQTKTQEPWSDIITYTSEAEFNEYASWTWTDSYKHNSRPLSISFVGLRDLVRVDKKKMTYLSFEFARITSGEYLGTHYFASLEQAADGTSWLFRVGYYEVRNGANTNIVIYYSKTINDLDYLPYLISCDYYYVHDPDNGVYRWLLDMRVKIDAFEDAAEFNKQVLLDAGVSFVQGVKPSNARVTFTYIKGVDASMISERDKFDLYLWLKSKLSDTNVVYPYDADLYEMANALWNGGFSSAWNAGGITQRLIYAVIDAPVNMLLAGMNFEFAGINIAGACLALLSLFVIYFVVRVIGSILAWL